MPFPETIPTLARALQSRGYEEPTPVQLAVLQNEEPERDQLVSARTGSGKTVAYGLAIAKTLLGEAEQFGPAAEPQALIISPTRELALQVQKELVWLYAHTGARIITCVGGMDIRSEARALERGAHIVVGTPGRLRDHLERNRLDTSALKAVVLDEADEMLNLGFREDLEFILEATPSERRTLMFSATIAKNIAAMAKRYQRNALRIDVAGSDEGHSDIDYRAIRIAPTDVENALVNVLRYYDAPATMVFCATREAVRRLQASLLERGFSVVALSGELGQKERNAALQALRDGHARVCVATDVAARGIDIPDLKLVVHADLPKEKETLQHRSGRTGRAGKKGTCILLVPYTRRRMAERLLGSAGIEATWASAPSAEEIRKLDRDRLIARLAPVSEESTEDLALAQSVMAECAPEAIALALVRLYSERLPSPEELIDHPALTEPVNAPGSREPLARDRWRDGPTSDTMWFRINIGRANNADPRWLLPLICRLGRVTKRDIGVIRIMDGETRFEIAGRVAAKFASSANKASMADKSTDEEIRVEALGADAQQEGGGRPAGRGPRGGAPRGGAPRGGAPRGAPRGGAPRGDRAPRDGASRDGAPRGEGAPRGRKPEGRRDEGERSERGSYDKPAKKRFAKEFPGEGAPSRKKRDDAKPVRKDGDKVKKPKKKDNGAKSRKG